MTAVRLAEFIDNNREDLLSRCREKASATVDPPSTKLSCQYGIPVFLDQVVHQLNNDSTHIAQLRASAFQHGRDLFFEGFTVGQLVHDYGAVCQSVTDLAVETGTTISSDDFRTLNRCLDDAIADAVAEYANQERASNAVEALRLRNLAYMALIWFEAIREGKVGAAGGTGDLLYRSLQALSALTQSPANKTAPGSARTID